MRKSTFLEVGRREQQPGESLHDLGLEIKRLTTLAHPRTDKVERDRIAREHFKRAITDPKLKEELFRARPETLSDAIAKAEIVESLYMSEQNKVRSRIGTCRREAEGAIGTLSSSRDDQDKVKEQVDGTREKMTTFSHDDKHTKDEIKEVWVPASIQGEGMMLCVDSGASKVTLTLEQYRLIPEERRPPLEDREVYLRQADGSKVKIAGAAQMEVRIGDRCESVEVYVAPLSDNLLGINFLQKTGAVIDFRRLQLIINGEQIDCRTRNDRPLYSRLVTRSETRIPAEHEMIIEVCTADSRRGAVVDATSTVIPMKVMNLEPHEQVLKAGTVLARLIPLAEEDVVNAQSATAIEQEGSEGEFPEHLRDLLEQCTTELNSDERDFVIEMLIQYQDVFSKGEFDLGRTKLVKHSIDTRDARPIRQPLRRSSPEQRAEVQRQVTELLSKGLIQPSDSPWASPVVLVNKKDGTKRLCLDYRKLNDVSVKDAYPLPRIDDSLDSLGGAKYFSTLDLAAGYWQVEMDEDARQKSAFVTASGLYEWNVLPFGLCNAPSTFERLMDNVLAGLRWEALLVYLDDVIVFGRTIQESVERLGTVFAPV